MVEFSYNFSSTLKKTIEAVETLRRHILLTPLSAKTELHHRFEAMVNRIYWSFSLSEKSLGKKEILAIVASQSKKKLSPLEKEVINYHSALRYIQEYWLVSQKTVTAKTVQTLNEIACKGKLRVAETELTKMLDYLQTAPEHPVVQAAIAQIQCLRISPFTYGNAQTSSLLSHLFLCKYGYDMRGLLVLEDYWRHNLLTYQSFTRVDALKNNNLTLWIEQFAKACVHQLAKVKNDLAMQHFTLDLSASILYLNDRQKEILAVLEAPQSSITNKKVQRLFKISQITASRDLAKLVSLDLLFSHGKGRSVYYTRI